MDGKACFYTSVVKNKSSAIYYLNSLSSLFYFTLICRPYVLVQVSISCAVKAYRMIKVMQSEKIAFGINFQGKYLLCCVEGKFYLNIHAPFLKA